MEEGLQQHSNQPSKRERRQLAKEQKRKEYQRYLRGRKIKKWSRGVGIAATIVLVIALSTRFIRVLPPTTMQGHIEESPPSHIVTEPIPENIQKHMLEHADGDNEPGVIVQYNCEKFECEADLVANLESVVNDYIDYAYLAPGPRYDGKIILTKLGDKLILKEFDETKIRDFIQ